MIDKHVIRSRFGSAIRRFSVASAIDHPAVITAGFDRTALTEPAVTAELPPLSNGLPATAIFDYKTPDELARYIVEEVNKQPMIIGTATSSRNGSAHAATHPTLFQDSLEVLFKNAVDAGKVDEGLGLLRAAAHLRPKFKSESDIINWPVPARFTRGPKLPHLIFISGSLFGSGVHHYARIAQEFKDVRPVSAIPLPGFGAGELLPHSLAAGIESLAHLVIEAAGDEPFVLAGNSSGGKFAHAVANYFENNRNTNLRGVALLDAFKGKGSGLPLSKDFFADLCEDTSRLGLYNSTRLTAMSAWCEFLPWSYEGRLKAPVLFVQCTQPWPAFQKRSKSRDPEYILSKPWSRSQIVRTIPVHHDAILVEGAALTGKILEEWIVTLRNHVYN